MKTRKHYNNHGKTMIKLGYAELKLKRISKRLGIRIVNTKEEEEKLLEEKEKYNTGKF